MEIKLRKNLNGLKDVGNTWWERMSAGLTSMCFTSSQSDPCVWMKKDVMILSYVDDCLMFSKDKRNTKETFINMRSQGYVFTDEGSIEYSLRTQIEYNDDGSITMSQPHLLKRII